MQIGILVIPKSLSEWKRIYRKHPHPKIRLLRSRLKSVSLFRPFRACSTGGLMWPLLPRQAQKASVDEGSLQGPKDVGNHQLLTEGVSHGIVFTRIPISLSEWK